MNWITKTVWIDGAILLAAAGLDFILGDPWRLPHPVQAMGWAISAYSKLILRLSLPGWAMRIGGVGLAGLIIGGSSLLSGYGLWWVGGISPELQMGTAIVLLASCFAGRSLRQAAEDVLAPLSAGDLSGARGRLARYVGRDTAQLTAEQVRRAVLETVSENAIDGVLAPLFYAILGAAISAGLAAFGGQVFLSAPGGLLGELSGGLSGGLAGGLAGGLSVPLAIAYKAASTLDSMVGYREAPYTDLGWFSARLEDGLTWLPCRMSVLAIALLSGRPQQVLRLCWRDARADPSPNAGWSECVYAAALGVQMGGANTYRGKVKIKPLLGDNLRPITDEVIAEALQLTRTSFLIGLLAGTIGIIGIRVSGTIGL